MRALRPLATWRPHSETGNGALTISTDLPQAASTFARRSKSSRSFHWLASREAHSGMDSGGSGHRNPSPVFQPRAVSVILPVPIGERRFDELLYKLHLSPGELPASVPYFDGFTVVEHLFEHKPARTVPAGVVDQVDHFHIEGRGQPLEELH